MERLLVTRIWLGLETFSLQTLEPQTEAVAMPVQNFHLAARAVEEDEQHRVEHRHLDIQLDQGGQAIDRFTEVDRLGVEVNGFDLGVGTHHGLGSRKIGSTASAGYRFI